MLFKHSPSKGQRATTVDKRRLGIQFFFLLVVAAAMFTFLWKKRAEPAWASHRDLCRHMSCHHDESGNIGVRYRRQDEVGTPFCLTYDFDSEQDRRVTVRERDSMQQERIPIDGLVAHLRERVEVGL